MRGYVMALIALALVAVPYAEPASAADGVDLETSLWNVIDRPVPDSPVQVNVAANNLGTTTATVTATTFTCAPVFSGGVFYAPQPYVSTT